jgi:hypothetical protein
MQRRLALPVGSELHNGGANTQLASVEDASEHNSGHEDREGKEDSMKARMLWSRILVVVGCIAMLLGAIDPLEGSLLILPGSGMVVLGLFVGVTVNV